MRIWRRNRNKRVCSVREINAHTIEFKKRWHIYCNINVIYIVFLLKKTENSNSHCRRIVFDSSFFLCALTIPFHLTQEQVFDQSSVNKMEVAFLGIWSSYEAFFKRWMTSNNCLVLEMPCCKFPVYNGQVIVNNHTFYYLI